MRGQQQPRDRAIAKLAARQHGVVAHSQLVDIGLSSDAIYRRLSAERLHRLHRGVYAVGHSVLPRWASFIAAVLACGPGALVSHQSAAELWGLLRTARSRIDVTAPGRSRHRTNGILLHLPRNLHPEDYAKCEGIPVTSIARTLLDLAAVLPYRQLLHAVEEAERLRLFDLKAIQRLLARNPGRRGVRALRAAIAEAGHDVPWTRSKLERRFLELCRNASLPQPAVNIWVEGCEVDAAWLKQKLLVELDSHEFHGTPAAFERDRKRDIALQIAGYQVIRITQFRIEREAGEVVKEIRALLGLRAPTGRAGSRGC